MKFLLALTFTLMVATSLVLARPQKGAPCDPKKCKLPACRCYNDPDAPGQIANFLIPQMVVLTFDFAFNPNTVEPYMQLFEDLRNPNNCSAKGTFFAQALNSEIGTLQRIHKLGHELGINSANGIIPTNRMEWEESFAVVMKMLLKAGVPKSEIRGARAPQLFSGGNAEFEAVKALGLKYESSCVNVEHSAPNHILWPYTLDNVHDTPSCSIGHTVSETFKGIWSVNVPVLDFAGLQCPVPSGCIPNVNDTSAVFELFYKAFNDHYYGNRTPFILDIDAQWVADTRRLEGTKEFLGMINTYSDVWMVNIHQMMEWMEHPAAMGMGSDFKAWDC